MYCKKCGTFIPDGVTVCSNCNTPVEVNTNNQYEQNTTNQYQNQAQYQQYAAPNYAQPGYQDPNAYAYMQASQNAETAKTLGILGIILTFFFTPICGWVLGGIARSKSKQAFEQTGDPRFKTGMTLGNWAIGVASVLTVFAIIMVILWVTVFAVALADEGYSYSSDFADSLSMVITNLISFM